MTHSEPNTGSDLFGIFPSVKLNSIIPGVILYDGSFGIREIVSVDAAAEMACYRILCMKAPYEYRADGNGGFEKHSMIGGTSQCSIRTLALWARSALDPGDIPRMLLKLEASRLRLSRPEMKHLEHFEEVRSFYDLDQSANFRGNLGVIRSLAKKDIISWKPEAPAGERLGLTDRGDLWRRARAQNLIKMTA